MSSSKRCRVEAEAEKAKYTRLVDEELRQLVGQELLLESDLTKADLLQFVKVKGFICEVKDFVDVMVQTMDGGSFGVRLEEGGTVAALKSEIQEAQGAALYRQQLFMLGVDAEGGNEVQEPLLDNDLIECSCMVMLSVQAEEEWSWDASSPLLARKVFELRGPNNSVAARIGQQHDYRHCMMTGPVMEAGAGKHTISMQLEGEYILCGVVSDGAACDEDHASEFSTVGSFMASHNGALYGNGKFYGNGYGKDRGDYAGRIESGDVLTMQLDTDAGTLRFWVNGKPHGPGFNSAVRGSLRWATSISIQGDIAVIVPTPAALQLWKLPPRLDICQECGKSRWVDERDYDY